MSHEGELLDLGVANNIVEKAGAWYSYQGDRVGQGKENARQFLREHRDIATEIEQKIREVLLPSAQPEATDTDDAAEPVAG